MSDEGRAKIERFEDLIAWQKVRTLTRSVYSITSQGAFARDSGLSHQIQRAAVSVMSNIAEGYERASVGEFHHFLLIAKASCAEIRSQLYIALDCWLHRPVTVCSTPCFDGGVRPDHRRSANVSFPATIATGSGTVTQTHYSSLIT